RPEPRSLREGHTTNLGPATFAKATNTANHRLRECHTTVLGPSTFAKAIAAESPSLVVGQPGRATPAVRGPDAV
ncbi:MAG: hypothetical protein ACK4V6_01640, partial [Microthrixaceae bacterium]